MMLVNAPCSEKVNVLAVEGALRYYGTPFQRSRSAGDLSRDSHAVFGQWRCSARAADSVVRDIGRFTLADAGYTAQADAIYMLAR